MGNNESRRDNFRGIFVDPAHPACDPRRVLIYSGAQYLSFETSNLTERNLNRKVREARGKLRAAGASSRINPGKIVMGSQVYAQFQGWAS